MSGCHYTNPSGPVEPFADGYINTSGNLVWGASCVAPLVQVTNYRSDGIRVTGMFFAPDCEGKTFPRPVAEMRTPFASVAIAPGETAVLGTVLPGATIILSSQDDEVPVPAPLPLQWLGIPPVVSLYRFNWSPGLGYVTVPYPCKYDVYTETFLDFNNPADYLCAQEVNLLEFCGCRGPPRRFPSSLLVSLEARARPCPKGCGSGN